jgi:hypothetical protein
MAALAVNRTEHPPDEAKASNHLILPHEGFQRKSLFKKSDTSPVRQLALRAN